MTSGPDDAPRQHEPTFADVMNGFSLDSGRPRKRRRWGRRRGEEAGRQEDPQSAPLPVHPSTPPPTPVPNEVAYTHGTQGDAGFAGSGYGGYQTGPIEPIRDEPLPPAVPTGASAVRPYAWTRGRTKSGFDLAIETLVSTSPQGREQLPMLQMEHRSVADLCDRPRSVAEVAALLKIPLGVARVLLGDMAGLGVVTVHQTASSTGNEPDLALMERVLSGLRRL
ncbi:DUF742 domain-containing protein [Pseudonocardia lutea]|jgi:hypothetical protein|uniref:DUF742 domain-containing protein n=1 Tax=Pseudonocardia lutea TaxID=2172015 RepID=A0ABW1I5R5_9PSEU